MKDYLVAAVFLIAVAVLTFGVLHAENGSRSILPRGLSLNSEGKIVVTDYQLFGCRDWRSLMTRVPNPLSGIYWAASNANAVPETVVFEEGDVVRGVEAYGFTFAVRDSGSGNAVKFEGGKFHDCVFDLKDVKCLLDGVSLDRCRGSLFEMPALPLLPPMPELPAR